MENETSPILDDVDPNTGGLECESTRGDGRGSPEGPEIVS